MVGERWLSSRGPRVTLMGGATGVLPGALFASLDRSESSLPHCKPVRIVNPISTCTFGLTRLRPVSTVRGVQYSTVPRFHGNHLLPFSSTPFKLPSVDILRFE